MRKPALTMVALSDTMHFEGTIEEREAALSRLERFADLMDSTFRVPGTNVNVGLEAVVGLVPGIGDAAGAVVACYVPFEGIRLGAPWPLVLKMFGNILIDAVGGSIPVIGDLFDVLWKANQRNVRLLKEYLDVSE